MSATAMSKARRGFALLSPDRLREIASKAGKASQANGNAHHFSKALATTAGRKGGLASGRVRSAKARARKLAEDGAVG